MGAYPAEYYAKLYLEQPWGGNGATNAMRALLKEIRAEMRDPLRRCSACEEPGYATLLEWPSRTQQSHKRRDRDYLSRRYVLCALCGHVEYFRSPSRHVTKVLSKEAQLEICRLAERGLSATALGKRYYVSRSTITKTLRDHGVPVRRPGGSVALKRIPLEDLHKIHYLHEVRGLSQRRIAELLDMPPGTLHSRIKTMRKEGWLPDERSHAKNVALRKRLDERRAA